MRALVWVCMISAAAACTRGAGDDYPILGGGGGVGGSKGGSGSSATADAPSSTLFYVCLLSDPRNLVLCDTTGAAGYTVSLSDGTTTYTAMTYDDGHFNITTPTGNNFIYTVTGSGIMKSVEFYKNAMFIPIIKTSAYATLQANNGTNTVTGHGDLFVRLLHNSAPQSSHPFSTTPTTGDVRYDAASATVWAMNTATGPLGTAWIPNLPSGTVTLTLDPQTSTPHDYLLNPIVDGALTFFRADF